MTPRLLALLCLCSLSLIACETAQDRAAREAQFNGKTLSEVIAVIGPPAQRSASSAKWHHTETRYKSTPRYTTINGQLVPAGSWQDPYQATCTYIAKLQNGWVTKSTYLGNACARFAPKLRSN